MLKIDRSIPLQIALVTYSILVLELAVIRWMSQQIRVFAYLNNLLLIAAFLGMGLGIGFARRQSDVKEQQIDAKGLGRLFPWTLPILTLLSALLAFAGPLGLRDLSFPDVSIALWGADGIRRGQTFLSTLTVVIVLFVIVASVFLAAGHAVGTLFHRLPPLRAYSADLIGSLAGVLAMAAAAALSTPPPVWLALGSVPIALLSRRWIDAACVVAILALAAFSIQGARFSPYNRLDLSRVWTPAGPTLVLAANRDFHQYLYDLSPGAIQSPLLSADERAEGARVRFIYDLPFRLSRDRRTALIVGAGTGNDVAAALRNGFTTVTSVDIDPVIIRVGRSLHPEHPYSDPRTLAVVNDARNFFERSRGERFDVVCFGLLDSHAMFSAMSTLRLDNYVYTADGLSAAWRLVAPGGVMAVTFQVWQGEWLADRIAATLETATGKRPLILGGETRLFLVGKDFDLAAATASVPLRRYRPPELSAVRITTDDWPFLYLRPGVFPIGYAAVLASVLILTAAGVRYAYGTQMFAPGGFDGVLFLMGAAFLLIETRGVTDLSLLFGSTWIVNSVVFGGVLAVAWLATEWLARHDLRRVEIWFAPLAASLLLSYWLRPAAFLRLPYVAGGVAGSLVNALPVGFAAIVFSALLRKSPNAVASLGSNLLGAVFGGCLEYVSMFAGLRSVTLVALALYLGALAILLRRLARDATLVAEPR